MYTWILLVPCALRGQWQSTSVYVVFLSGSSHISRIPLCQTFFRIFFLWDSKLCFSPPILAWCLVNVHLNLLVPHALRGESTSVHAVFLSDSMIYQGYHYGNVFQDFFSCFSVVWYTWLSIMLEIAFMGSWLLSTTETPLHKDVINE